MTSSAHRESQKEMGLSQDGRVLPTTDLDADIGGFWKSASSGNTPSMIGMRTPSHGRLLRKDDLLSLQERGLCANPCLFGGRHL